MRREPCSLLLLLFFHLHQEPGVLQEVESNELEVKKHTQLPTPYS